MENFSLENLGFFCLLIGAFLGFFVSLHLIFTSLVVRQIPELLFTCSLRDIKYFRLEGTSGGCLVQYPLQSHWSQTRLSHLLPLRVSASGQLNSRSLNFLSFVLAYQHLLGKSKLDRVFQVWPEECSMKVNNHLPWSACWFLAHAALCAALPSSNDTQLSHPKPVIHQGWSDSFHQSSFPVR